MSGRGWDRVSATSGRLRRRCPETHSWELDGSDVAHCRDCPATYPAGALPGEDCCYLGRDTAGVSHTDGCAVQIERMAAGKAEAKRVRARGRRSDARAQQALPGTAAATDQGDLFAAPEEPSAGLQEHWRRVEEMYGVPRGYAASEWRKRLCSRSGT